jgi:thiol-disulfide isomerase/thioredoxin
MQMIETMKRLKTRLLFVSLLLVLPVYMLAQTGYNIQLKVNGFANKDVILGYHSNKQIYVKDTVQINEKGIGVFAGKEALPGGIYLFYLPNGKFFDVLIDREQHFSLETDTADFYKNLKIKGATEPQVFLDLQLFMEENGLRANDLREQIKNAESDSVLIKSLTNQLEGLSNQVKQYWEDLETKHKGSFVASFVKAIQELPIPEFELPEGTQNPDSVLHFKRAWYMKDHFFDNIDLSDGRMIRTPFFHAKLERYFSQILIPIPDTVANQSIRLIEQARPNKEMFRYLVQFSFNHVNNSQIMGMDAAMVTLAEKYYLTGEAYWTTDEFITNLRTRVAEIKPTLLGKVAHDLKMEGLHGEFYRLNEVNALITVLVFYEPDCGHCKKEIPLLYKTVFEPYRNKGVQFFTVYNLHDKEKWEAFINEHSLFDWINVYDPYNQTRFRNYYDIKSTPMIYVLDKNKKIIAKRIDAQQLPSFIDRQLGL